MYLEFILAVKYRLEIIHSMDSKISNKVSFFREVLLAVTKRMLIAPKDIAMSLNSVLERP